MSPLFRGRRMRRLLPLGALAALVATLAPVALGADTPPPQRTRCAGRTAAVPNDPSQVNYRLSCRGSIKSFAIVSSDSVTGFEANADVFTGNTTAPAESDSAGCEGDFPSRGFICKGTITGKNTMTGLYEPEAAPCSVKGRWLPRVAVVVVAADGTASGPFGLGGPGKCKAPRSAHRPR